MKDNIKYMLISICVLSSTVPVSAMHIQISGEPCPLIIYATPAEGQAAAEQPPSSGEDTASQTDSAPENSETEAKQRDLTTQQPEGNDTGTAVSLSEFELYGLHTGFALISTEDMTGYVSAADLSEKLSEIPMADLPDGSMLTDIKNGTSGENVKKLQQQLIDLGYLERDADGHFGGMSAAAINKFQEEHRITPSGIADIKTQMAIAQVTAGLPDTLEVGYPTNLSADVKFAKIWGQTEVDLEPYMAPGWKFSYDEFERFGTLDRGVPVGTFTAAGTDIHRITLNASLKVIIEPAEEGDKLNVVPCLAVESNGVYRPYLQAVILNNGKGTITLTGGKSRGGLNGVSLEEFGYIPLTEEALEAIKSGSVVSMRLKGLNEIFDMDYTGDPDTVTAFAETVTIAQ